MMRKFKHQAIKIQM